MRSKRSSAKYALSSSPLSYKPVSQIGEDLDSQQTSMELRDTDVDTLCGFWTVRPKLFQPCANIGCFTAFYSLAALITSTLSVYVNSQITTLERQFGFSSKQTGLIMAANDIGFLICVLFVSYSASRIHIPRSLGIATIMFGLSGITCSLPHFIFGSNFNSDLAREEINVTSLQPRKASLDGALCDISNSTKSTCGAGRSSSGQSIIAPEHIATMSLIIIVIGMMLQGFGKAPRVSFTITYIDDNTATMKTGFYLGIITTLGMFGPAVAFLMGGIFSKMYVTLKPTKLNPFHPRWIGAWWLGYIMFGCLALVISVPLFCFPRRLPKKTPKENGHQSRHVASIFTQERPLPPELNNNTQPSKQLPSVVRPSARRSSFGLLDNVKLKTSSFLQHIKDFMLTFPRLWSNPIYLLMVLSNCFILFSVAGTTSYSPKYLERVFNVPAFKANYIMAGKVLFSSCIGTFVGGYLTKRLRMTARKALKFVNIVVCISVFSTVMGFVFKCDQPTVHNWSSWDESCNHDCNCPENSFFAICGEDRKTYYSPCHAGCDTMENGVYHNCTCIAGGTAVSGMCDYSCAHLYPYAVFNALRSLVGTLCIIPKMIVIIRCVDDKDKAMAIGFSSFMTSLLGWFLGPIVFGYVIDGICTIWDVKCGVTGRCLLYDNDLFRIKLHSYSTVAMACSCLCLVIANIYAWSSKCLDDPPDIDDAKKNVLKMAVVGVDNSAAQSGDSDKVVGDNDRKTGEDDTKKAEDDSKKLNADAAAKKNAHEGKTDDDDDDGAKQSVA